MLALIAAVSLGAAPVGHPAADAVLYVPRLDKAQGALAFLRRAGERTVMLRASSWRSELHPLLSLDLEQPASLTSAGIDPAGSLTVSFVDDARMSCTSLKDAKAFESRAGQRLKVLGSEWKSKSAVGAKVQDTVVAGYTRVGSSACAVSNADGAEKLLSDAASALKKATAPPGWKTAQSLPGSVFFITRYGVASLDGDANRLTLEGKAAKTSVPKLRSGASSPYGAMPASGVVLVKTQVDPTETEVWVRTLQRQLAAVCAGCDFTAVDAVARQLPSLLTGNAVLRVDRVQVQGSLANTARQYAAVKHAYAAEVKSGETVKALLEKHALTKLSLGNGGEVQVGVHGQHLYMGNDDRAVKALLDAIPTKPERVEHGAEFSVDPRGLAQALSQVSLLDVMGAQELAAVFAAGAELGPLLSASERISGWMDSAAVGPHRFQLTWSLQK